MTKYTFLLPAYKAKFLEESLRSILQQTYTDFKVIVSDDCSPEDIKGIFNKVCSNDKRFEYRRNNTNMGGKSLVSHWNLLVDMCDTEFLIMASDDDVYDPHFLKEIDKLTVKYPDVDLFHSRVRCIDENGEVLKLDAKYEEYVSQIEFLAFLGYKNHIECIANNVYRTVKLKFLGSFVDLPLAWGTDVATNNRMAQHGVVSTMSILFSFRMSGMNISNFSKERCVDRKKLEAAFKFDKLSAQLLSGFSNTGSKLYIHQLQMATEAQMLVVNTTVWAHCTVLSFFELLKCIRYLKLRNYIHSRYYVYKLLSKYFFAKLISLKAIYSHE